MNLRIALPIVFAFAFPNFVLPVHAQVVPGTGQQIMEVFDDFEDPEWNFTPNLPKSSANIDKTERHPSGFSANRLYLESMYRGTPDFVRRMETPEGGIRGSKGCLAMQTLNSGVPGRLSHTFQQDDLIAGVQQKLGYMMPVGWTPSYTCRVYIPPFEKWERRHGSHFGFRADCTTTITKTSSVGKFFKNVGSHKALEQYWPGFFIQLNLKQMTREPEDFAQIIMRADTLGHEVPGPKITRPGWWTLGMTFTADGKVHYYAHEGTENLTAKDHLYSNFPYGYKCEQTSTFFFNIVNQDDGHSWSTRWFVDDPKVFVASGSYRPPVPQVAQAQQKPATPAVPATPAIPAQAPAVPTQTQPVIPVSPPATSQISPPATQPVVNQPSVTQSPPKVLATSPALAKPIAAATAPVAPVAAKPSLTPPQAASPSSIALPPLSSLPQLATKPVEIPAIAPKSEIKLPATEMTAPQAPPTTTPVVVPAQDPVIEQQSATTVVAPAQELPTVSDAEPKLPDAPALPEMEAPAVVP